MKHFFISFSSGDLPLAQFVQRYLNDLFQQKADFFLSDSIEPSEIWLNRIKREAQEADGGLFLLTPISIFREWVHIEFGILWGQEKQIFPLLGGGLSISDIPEPLRIFQATKLDDETEVAKFIRKLSKSCGFSAPPIYNAKLFCEEIAAQAGPLSVVSDMSSVSRLLHLEDVPQPESIQRNLIEIEPSQLFVQIVRDHTLSIYRRVLQEKK